MGTVTRQHEAVEDIEHCWQQRMNSYHPYAKLDGALQWSAHCYQLYVKVDNNTAHRYYDIGSVSGPDYGSWQE